MLLFFLFALKLCFSNACQQVYTIMFSQNPNNFPATSRKHGYWVRRPHAMHVCSLRPLIPAHYSVLIQCIALVLTFLCTVYPILIYDILSFQYCP